MPSFCLHIFLTKKVLKKLVKNVGHVGHNLIQIPHFNNQSAKFFVPILILLYLTYYYGILSKVFPTSTVFEKISPTPEKSELVSST
jgi:hypothetical protein